MLESAKTGEPLYRKAYQDVQNALTRACTGLVNHLFVRLWEKGSKGWTHRGLNAENIKSKTSKEEPPTSDASLELLAEQFIALRFLIFIRYVILQLRNLLGFIAVGFLL